jgi:hypothetical protein
MKFRPLNFRSKRDSGEDFSLIAHEVRAVRPSLVIGDDK